MSDHSAQEGMTYVAQAYADLQSEIAKLGLDFSNYGDWPITLPAGHWRALASSPETKAQVEAVAAILDPGAMQSMGDLLLTWEQWMIENTPPKGWGRIDPKKHARACAEDEFEGLAARRFKAIRKATKIASLFSPALTPETKS